MSSECAHSSFQYCRYSYNRSFYFHTHQTDRRLQYVTLFSFSFLFVCLLPASEQKNECEIFYTLVLLCYTSVTKDKLKRKVRFVFTRNSREKKFVFFFFVFFRLRFTRKAKTEQKKTNKYRCCVLSNIFFFFFVLQCETKRKTPAKRFINNNEGRVR